MESNVFPVILSAPTGGGKTTIKDFLLNKYSIFEFSVTCTTRPKRKNEVHGKDYYFLTDDEFDDYIKKDAFLEWANVHKWRYGTLKQTVIDILDKGKYPLMTIDVQGAMSVKKIFTSSLLIFIIPPSLNEWVERLRKRGDDNETINLRLKTAIKELEMAERFDYLIINDKIDIAAEKIYQTVNCEINKISKNIVKIQSLFRELQSLINNGGVK